MILPLLLSLCAGALQGAGPARLERPDAVVPEPLSLIRGVRELSDGRVLVTDWTEQRLLMIDPGFRRVTALASVGAGPAEFRLPAGLFPLAGDTTLLVDVGNARLSLITPDGRIARSIPAARPGLGSPGGVDARGRVYFAIPSWAREAAGTHEDSTTIVRLEPATDRVTPLTVVRGTTWPRNKGPRLTPGMGHVAFSAQDAWRVAPDGTLIIVRATGYRIERVGAQGRSTGPSYAYPTAPVTKADRLAYVREFLARSPTSGRGPDGGMGHTPIPSEAAIAKMEETNEFAAELPPFNAAWVHLASDGELWVGRSRHTGQPIVYDRFDPAGKRIGQVSMAANRAVVGIGKRFVYVASTDDDGLQQLERFPRPTP